MSLRLTEYLCRHCFYSFSNMKKYVFGSLIFLALAIYYGKLKNREIVAHMRGSPFGYYADLIPEDIASDLLEMVKKLKEYPNVNKETKVSQKQKRITVFVNPFSV